MANGVRSPVHSPSPAGDKLPSPVHSPPACKVKRQSGGHVHVAVDRLKIHRACSSRSAKTAASAENVAGGAGASSADAAGDSDGLDGLASCCFPLGPMLAAAIRRYKTPLHSTSLHFTWSPILSPTDTTETSLGFVVVTADFPSLLCRCVSSACRIFDPQGRSASASVSSAASVHVLSAPSASA